MFEPIEEYYGDDVMVGLLTGVASDDSIRQYVELSRLLIAVGYDSHLASFDLLESMVENEQIDSTSITIEVDTILREAVRLSILECGIRYDVEIDTEMLVELATAVLAFNTTETPQRLIDLIESSEDCDEAFCLVLGELTGRQSTDWETVIESVSPDVIHRVRSLSVSALGHEVSVKETDYELAKRLENLRNISKSVDITLEDASETPSLESMYLVYLPRLIDQPAPVVVDSLYAMACLTSTSLESADEKVSELLSDFCGSELERLLYEGEGKKIREKYASVYGN